MLVDDGYGPIDDPDREFDLIPRHATENKDFVRPHANALILRGVQVWFDETAIAVSDSSESRSTGGLGRTATVLAWCPTGKSSADSS